MYESNTQEILRIKRFGARGRPSNVVQGKADLLLVYAFVAEGGDQIQRKHRAAIGTPVEIPRPLVLAEKAVVRTHFRKDRTELLIPGPRRDVGGVERQNAFQVADRLRHRFGQRGSPKPGLRVGWLVAARLLKHAAG